MQHEFQLALPQTRGDVRIVGLPSASVPQHDRSSAILSLGNSAFESPIFEGVILHFHGQAFHGWIKRGPLGNRPGEQDAIPLKPKVIVEMAGLMFLNYKRKLLRRFPNFGGTLWF